MIVPLLFLFLDRDLSSLSKNFQNKKSPESSIVDGGYEHLATHFGFPPYGGGSILGHLHYHPNSDLCDTVVETEEEEATMVGPTETSPFILMVDRGTCPFATKVCSLVSGLFDSGKVAWKKRPIFASNRVTRE